jgi:pyruvate/2-oxoglutarate/acetoin dehydrogenase E1 component
MFAEFMGVALDQLVTEAATLRYLSRGEYSVPLVVRMSAGPGLGFGAQHSQTLEHWFAGTSGLKVVSPSGANVAYGLLRAAIRDNDPVVFIEPRILYGEREEVRTGDDAIVPLGKARVIRPGEDVTVVALGQTVPTATAAAAGADWSAEIIDLQTLVPWDRDTVLDSAQRTGRLVTVEANPGSGGWGADLAAVASAELFGRLKAPVLRVTCPDLPVPFAAELESRYVPSPDYLRQMISAIVTDNRLPRAWWEEEAHA